MNKTNKTNFSYTETYTNIDFRDILELILNYEENKKASEHSDTIKEKAAAYYSSLNQNQSKNKEQSQYLKNEDVEIDDYDYQYSGGYLSIRELVSKIIEINKTDKIKKIWFKDQFIPNSDNTKNNNYYLIIERIYPLKEHYNMCIIHNNKQSNACDDSQCIKNKKIHYYSNYSDIFIMPNKSIILKSISIVDLGDEEKYKKKRYEFNASSAINFNVYKAISFIQKILKIDLCSSSDSLADDIKEILKNKTRQLSIIKIDKNEASLEEQFNIIKISQFTDIFNIDNRRICVTPTKYFEKFIIEKLLKVFDDKETEYKENRISEYVSYATAYFMWGNIYYQSCKNKLLRLKLLNDFDNEQNKKKQATLALFIYNQDFIKQNALIPSAISPFLKDKFSILNDEITKGKNENYIFVDTSKEHKKAFRKASLEITITLSTVLISVSSLWSLSTWIYDKNQSNGSNTQDWFLLLLVVIVVSGLILLFTFVYQTIKFIANFRIYRKNLKILKIYQQTMNKIDKFNQTLNIDEEDLDLIAKNIINIKKINKELLSVSIKNSKNKK